MAFVPKVRISLDLGMLKLPSCGLRFVYNLFFQLTAAPSLPAPAPAGPDELPPSGGSPEAHAVTGGGSKTLWVAPSGGRAKLHWRVDVGAEDCVKLCRPQDELKAGFRKGDTAESWGKTRLAWCPKCLLIRPI